MTLFGWVAMIGHFRMNCIEQIKRSDLTVSFERQRESVAQLQKERFQGLCMDLTHEVRM